MNPHLITEIERVMADDSLPALLTAAPIVLYASVVLYGNIYVLPKKYPTIGVFYGTEVARLVKHKLARNIIISPSGLRELKRLVHGNATIEHISASKD